MSDISISEGLKDPKIVSGFFAMLDAEFGIDLDKMENGEWHKKQRRKWIKRAEDIQKKKQAKKAVKRTSPRAPKQKRRKYKKKKTTSPCLIVISSGPDAAKKK